MAKLIGWTRAVQVAAVYSFEGLHLTEELLLSAMRWENNWLRKIFKIRVPEGFGRQAYMESCSKVIRELLSITKLLRLHHKIIMETLRSAQRSENPVTLILDGRHEVLADID